MSVVDGVQPEQPILAEVDTVGVALVTLNRPAKLNAMTPVMQQGLCTRLADLDRDPAVRVIVLTGAGRGFCAGADLAVLDDITSSEFAGDPGREQVDLAIPLDLSTPLVAAVNGAVAGMGFSYMLMADLRFADEKARIGSTFARLGLVAEWGSAATLRALVGPAHAAELLLSGRIVDAPEALAMGLVQRVVPAGTVVEAALAWARDVARHCSPTSTAIIKAQLRRAGARAEFDRSVELMLASFGRPDLAEALAARALKRPPQFGPADRGALAAAGGAAAT